MVRERERCGDPSTGMATHVRRWAPLILVAGVVLVVIGVVVGVSLGGGAGTATVNAQFAEIERACSEWVASGTDQPAPAVSWCTRLMGWMSDRMGVYSGMWASPTAMRATCEQWATSTFPQSEVGANRTPWCDDMVSWMHQHAAHWGSWNGWLMHGPMMG